MRRSRWIWLVWLVVFLSYLVPFTILSNVAAWHGSLLLWSLAGVSIIAINVYITGAFRFYDTDADDVGEEHDGRSRNRNAGSSERSGGVRHD